MNKKLKLLIFLILFNNMILVTLPAVEILKDKQLRGIHITLVDKLPISENDLFQLVKNGVKTIPITMQTHLLSKIKKQSASISLKHQFKQMHILLDWCKKFGCKIIITQNHFPLDPKDKMKICNPLFWKTKQYLDEILNFAELVSKEFNNRGKELLAYTIVSEPLIRGLGYAKTPIQWIDVFKKIIYIIRKNDKDRYIYFSTGPGGTGRNFNNFIPFNDKKILYGFNFYSPHKYTHQGIEGRKIDIEYPSLIWNKNQLEKSMLPIINFKKKYNLPIFVGEFSVVNGAKGQYQYLKDILEIFNKHGFGWAYFAYSGYKGWNLHYEKNDIKEQYKIVNDSNSKRLNLIYKYINK